MPDTPTKRAGKITKPTREATVILGAKQAKRQRAKADCVAVILAGGQSTRMGRDKSRIQLNGNSLTAIVQESTSVAGLKTSIIRRDLVERCGPLGGIYTALKSLRAKRMLFLSCDAPFVSPELIRRIPSMRGRAVFAELDGVVGFPFVLDCACLSVVEQQIERKQYSLQKLATALAAKRWRVPLKYRDQLFNVNTPADLEAAKLRITRV